MKHGGGNDSGDKDAPLRPVMGRRRVPDDERTHTFRALMQRALQRHGGMHSGARHAKAQRGLVAVRAPHAFSRRCVIKAGTSR
jgi:hypothetical protein